jgi:hypothetical protein
LCFVHIRVLTFIIKRGSWNTFQIVEYIFNLLGSLLIIDQIQAWDICHCPPDKILRVGGEGGPFLYGGTREKKEAQINDPANSFKSE